MCDVSDSDSDSILDAGQLRLRLRLDFIRGPRRGGRCSEGLKNSRILNLAWKVCVFHLIARIHRAVCNGYKLTFLFSAEGPSDSGFVCLVLENGL